MDFEFDKRKSEANKKKHGIGFFLLMHRNFGKIQIISKSLREPKMSRDM